MKARKRILNIRKQSRIGNSRENVWYSSEESLERQSPVSERKSWRTDHLSILSEDYDRFSLDYSERSKNKKECPFVVDWQMNDTF